jgi:transketolase
VPEAESFRLEIRPPAGRPPVETGGEPPPPAYALGDSVATREAFGAALARLGGVDSRVVALDGDVKNSTYTDKFEAAHPDRLYQCFIAEQAMLGAAMGLAARGAIPFPATFAAFLTRAADFIRMLAISHLNVKIVGSHSGVSIGEDGPSQMALEDLAMMSAQPDITVLYPSDGVSAERLVAAAAQHHGPVYIRTSRPKTAVIYDNAEAFPIGGCKVVRQSRADRATIIAAGVTLFEALDAHDELKKQGISVRVIDLYSVQPVDAATLQTAARETGLLVTVEDHYAVGGIGDAVARAVAPIAVGVKRLAVGKIPRSGKPQELLDAYGISAAHIVSAVTGALARS